MTTSDWITISFSLVAVLVGAGVSWAFFRTQLLSDQGSLQQKLAHIDTTQSRILDRLDLTDKIGENSDLAEIRSTVERIDSRLHDAVRTIVGDVKEQQTNLACKIQDQFERQSESATQIVKDAFAAEVRKFVSDGRKQDKLIQSLVTSFMDGLKTMGEYQRVNVETQSATSLSMIEEQINGSINQVLEQVVDLKEQLPTLAAPKKEDVARIG